MASQVWEVDSRQIEVGNPGKTMFPDAAITKAKLASYWHRIAPTVLPHLRDRPLSLKRFPDGIGTKGFFQKHAPGHAPDWIRRETLNAEQGRITHLLADDAASLVWLADQAAIELHVALSRIDRPYHPDRLIFDLDPSDDDFGKVRRVARRLLSLLEDTEAPVALMLTGSRGVHVVVPLDRSAGFDDARALARRIAERVADDDPDTATIAHRKRDRGKRVFIDYLRNAYGQTTIAPYSPRARANAPVATPIAPRALDDGGLTADRYTLKTLFRRLSQTGDPWADLGDRAVSASTLGERL